MRCINNYLTAALISTQTAYHKDIVMKEQIIKWASHHDWYIGHGVDVENKLFIRVKEYYVGLSGHVFDKAIDFTDFQALRKWAGY